MLEKSRDLVGRVETVGSGRLLSRTHGAVLVGWLVGCMLLAGCGSEDPERPATFPVSGVVHYNGQPLAEAYVTFQSSGDDPRTAYGTTDDEGRFTLTTFETGDGAVAGEHRVQVLKFETVEASGKSSDVPPGGPTAPPPKPESLIPDRYSSFENSGLTATVSDDGENEVVLELTD